MHNNLIISGGIFHPFDKSSETLADVLGDLGIESQRREDVDAGLAELSSGDFDLLTINALRWGMMTADKYEPYRDEWAYQMPQDSRDRLTDFVLSGGALLGMHTASICFDDWPEWGELLGGSWQWGVSHHPPLGRVTARPSGVRHDVVRGIESIELEDEIYHDLKLQPDVVPLLLGECGTGSEPQPVCWAREYGSGRVVYDALGHNATSINHPQHRQLIQQAASWLLSS